MNVLLFGSLVDWGQWCRFFVYMMPFGLFPVQLASASEEWSATLERLDRRASEVNDLTASFEEYKYTTLMKEPLVTKGEVRMLGERSRWDTYTPTQMVMTVDPREVKLYYPDRNSMEIFSIDARLRPLIVSPVSSLSRLREQFDIKPLSGDDSPQVGTADQKLLVLLLDPIDPSMKQHVDHIRLVLESETAHVREVELKHPDGDRTVIRFGQVRMNTGLSEADVTLTVPPKTKTHRVEKPVHQTPK
jgi:outer membrane lipoprotein-sorting protein